MASMASDDGVLNGAAAAAAAERAAAADFLLSGFHACYGTEERGDGGRGAVADGRQPLDDVLAALCAEHKKPAGCWVGPNAGARVVLPAFYREHSLDPSDLAGLLVAVEDGVVSLSDLLQRLCGKTGARTEDWAGSFPTALRAAATKALSPEEEQLEDLWGELRSSSASDSSSAAASARGPPAGVPRLARLPGPGLAAKNPPGGAQQQQQQAQPGKPTQSAPQSLERTPARRSKAGSFLSFFGNRARSASRLSKDPRPVSAGRPSPQPSSAKAGGPAGGLSAENGGPQAIPGARPTATTAAPSGTPDRPKPGGPQSSVKAKDPAGAPNGLQARPGASGAFSAEATPNGTPDQPKPAGSQSSANAASVPAKVSAGASNGLQAKPGASGAFPAEATPNGTPDQPNSAGPQSSANAASVPVKESTGASNGLQAKPGASGASSAEATSNGTPDQLKPGSASASLGAVLAKTSPTEAWDQLKPGGPRSHARSVPEPPASVGSQEASGAVPAETNSNGKPDQLKPESAGAPGAVLATEAWDQLKSGAPQSQAKAAPESPASVCSQEAAGVVLAKTNPTEAWDQLKSGAPQSQAKAAPEPPASVCSQEAAGAVAGETTPNRTLQQQKPAAPEGIHGSAGASGAVLAKAIPTEAWDQPKPGDPFSNGKPAEPPASVGSRQESVGAPGAFLAEPSPLDAWDQLKPGGPRSHARSLPEPPASVSSRQESPGAAYRQNSPTGNRSSAEGRAQLLTPDGLRLFQSAEASLPAPVDGEEPTATLAETGRSGVRSPCLQGRAQLTPDGLRLQSAAASLAAPVGGEEPARATATPDASSAVLAETGRSGVRSPCLQGRAQPPSVAADRVDDEEPATMATATPGVLAETGRSCPQGQAQPRPSVSAEPDPAAPADGQQPLGAAGTPDAGFAGSTPSTSTTSASGREPQLIPDRRQSAKLTDAAAGPQGAPGHFAGSGSASRGLAPGGPHPAKSSGGAAESGPPPAAGGAAGSFPGEILRRPSLRSQSDSCASFSAQQPGGPGGRGPEIVHSGVDGDGTGSQSSAVDHRAGASDPLPHDGAEDPHRRRGFQCLVLDQRAAGKASQSGLNGLREGQQRGSCQTSAGDQPTGASHPVPVTDEEGRLRDSVVDRYAAGVTSQSGPGDQRGGQKGEPPRGSSHTSSANQHTGASHLLPFTEAEGRLSGQERGSSRSSFQDQYAAGTSAHPGFNDLSEEQQRRGSQNSCVDLNADNTPQRGFNDLRDGPHGEQQRRGSYSSFLDQYGAGTSFPSGFNDLREDNGDQQSDPRRRKSSQISDLDQHASTMPQSGLAGLLERQQTPPADDTPHPAPRDGSATWSPANNTAATPQPHATRDGGVHVSSAAASRPVLEHAETRYAKGVAFMDSPPADRTPHSYQQHAHANSTAKPQPVSEQGYAKGGVLINGSSADRTPHPQRQYAAAPDGDAMKAIHASLTATPQPAPEQAEKGYAMEGGAFLGSPPSSPPSDRKPDPREQHAYASPAATPQPVSAHADRGHARGGALVDSPPSDRTPHLHQQLARASSAASPPGLRVSERAESGCARGDAWQPTREEAGPASARPQVSAGILVHSEPDVLPMPGSIALRAGLAPSLGSSPAPKSGPARGRDQSPSSVNDGHGLLPQCVAQGSRRPDNPTRAANLLPHAAAGRGNGGFAGNLEAKGLPVFGTPFVSGLSPSSTPGPTGGGGGVVGGGFVGRSPVRSASSSAVPELCFTPAGPALVQPRAEGAALRLQSQPTEAGGFVPFGVQLLPCVGKAAARPAPGGLGKTSPLGASRHDDSFWRLSTSHLSASNATCDRPDEPPAAALGGTLPRSPQRSLRISSRKARKQLFKDHLLSLPAPAETQHQRAATPSWQQYASSISDSLGRLERVEENAGRQPVESRSSANSRKEPSTGLASHRTCPVNEAPAAGFEEPATREPEEAALRQITVPYPPSSSSTTSPASSPVRAASFVTYPSGCLNHSPNSLSPRSPRSPRPHAPSPSPWLAAMEAFYRKHNPAKIATIPMLLAKYEGHEVVLWEAILEKYAAGCEQSAAAAAAAAQPAPPRARRSTPGKADRGGNDDEEPGEGDGVGSGSPGSTELGTAADRRRMAAEIGSFLLRNAGGGDAAEAPGGKPASFSRRAPPGEGPRCDPDTVRFQVGPVLSRTSLAVLPGEGGEALASAGRCPDASFSKSPSKERPGCLADRAKQQACSETSPAAAPPCGGGEAASVSVRKSPNASFSKSPPRHLPPTNEQPPPGACAAQARLPTSLAVLPGEGEAALVAVRKSPHASFSKSPPRHLPPANEQPPPGSLADRATQSRASSREPVVTIRLRSRSASGSLVPAPGSPSLFPRDTPRLQEAAPLFSVSSRQTHSPNLPQQQQKQQQEQQQRQQQQQQHLQQQPSAHHARRATNRSQSTSPAFLPSFDSCPRSPAREATPAEAGHGQLKPPGVRSLSTSPSFATSVVPFLVGGHRSRGGPGPSPAGGRSSSLEAPPAAPADRKRKKFAERPGRHAERSLTAARPEPAAARLPAGGAPPAFRAARGVSASPWTSNASAASAGSRSPTPATASDSLRHVLAALLQSPLWLPPGGSGRLAEVPRSGVVDALRWHNLLAHAPALLAVVDPHGTGRVSLESWLKAAEAADQTPPRNAAPPAFADRGYGDDDWRDTSASSAVPCELSGWDAAEGASPPGRDARRGNMYAERPAGYQPRGGGGASGGGGSSGKAAARAAAKNKPAAGAFGMPGVDLPGYAARVALRKSGPTHPLSTRAAKRPLASQASAPSVSSDEAKSSRASKPAAPAVLGTPSCGPGDATPHTTALAEITAIARSVQLLKESFLLQDDQPQSGQPAAPGDAEAARAVRPRSVAEEAPPLVTRVATPALAARPQQDSRRRRLRTPQQAAGRRASDGGGSAQLQQQELFEDPRYAASESSSADASSPGGGARGLLENQASRKQARAETYSSADPPVFREPYLGVSHTPWAHPQTPGGRGEGGEAPAGPRLSFEASRRLTPSSTREALGGGVAQGGFDGDGSLLPWDRDAAGSSKETPARPTDVFPESARLPLWNSRDERSQNPTAPVASVPELAEGHAPHPASAEDAALFPGHRRPPAAARALGPGSDTPVYAAGPTAVPCEDPPIFRPSPALRPQPSFSAAPGPADAIPRSPTSRGSDPGGGQGPILYSGGGMSRIFRSPASLCSVEPESLRHRGLSGDKEAPDQLRSPVSQSSDSASLQSPIVYRTNTDAPAERAGFGSARRNPHSHAQRNPHPHTFAQSDGAGESNGTAGTHDPRNPLQTSKQAGFAHSEQRSSPAGKRTDAPTPASGRESGPSRTPGSFPLLDDDEDDDDDFFLGLNASPAPPAADDWALDLLEVSPPRRPGARGSLSCTVGIGHQTQSRTTQPAVIQEEGRVGCSTTKIAQRPGASPQGSRRRAASGGVEDEAAGRGLPCIDLLADWSPLRERAGRPGTTARREFAPGDDFELDLDVILVEQARSKDRSSFGVSFDVLESPPPLESSQVYCGNRTSNPEWGNTASIPGGGACGPLEARASSLADDLADLGIGAPTTTSTPGHSGGGRRPSPGGANGREHTSVGGAVGTPPEAKAGARAPADAARAGAGGVSPEADANGGRRGQNPRPGAGEPVDANGHAVRVGAAEQAHSAHASRADALGGFPPEATAHGVRPGPNPRPGAGKPVDANGHAVRVDAAEQAHSTHASRADALGGFPPEANAKALRPSSRPGTASGAAGRAPVAHAPRAAATEPPYFSHASRLADPLGADLDDWLADSTPNAAPAAQGEEIEHAAGKADARRKKRTVALPAPPPPPQPPVLDVGPELREPSSSGVSLSPSPVPTSRFVGSKSPLDYFNVISSRPS
ncbi:hypothetical protein DIPPA_18652 [Diplonema papillatum]|nr:hypothetical protein DIPPA_18652 [Diplonema papillatum]